MPTDKEIKAQFKVKASKDPDKYYATGILKKEGFTRKQCPLCKIYFWTTNPDQKVCGDPACSGGFRFIGKTPAKHKLDFIEVWKKFSTLFKKWGYTPIQRYPVVARWRDDMDFVMASIADFQPYVVSGEVEPPANPLVIPQFCLRFQDIDNVGITGAHMTGFVMIGQHAFVKPKDWDQAKYFTDIHNWLKKGLGLPNEEITFHEDAWAGGGNFGPCMEFFSRGCEIGNQVYMLYEITPAGPKELSLKILDMGMGQDRNAWFSTAKNTIYDAVFPTVCKKLYSATGIKTNKTLLKRYVPYAALLNIDEVKDIEKAWKTVSKKTGLEIKELRDTILPLAAVYSIGEHARALLVALSDGALPSNVGGGYNLRILARRAFSFIDKYDWNVYLPDVCEWHAQYLKPLFPELSANFDNVQKILDVEKSKYISTKQKSREIIKKIIKTKIPTKKLLELYDSQGIAPSIIQEEAAAMGRKVTIPENFYAKVSQLHAKKEKIEEIKQEKLPLEGLPDTEALYFDDYTITDFTGKVLKIINNFVILDKTLFYPTSGGQENDTGTLNSEQVVDVFKQGAIIVHKLAKKPGFKQGDLVDGKIDFKTRKQLAQHHTSTHIINAAARKVLGPHINQAGAKKTVEKAHLDITHYQSITKDELDKIQAQANKIVKANYPVYSSFMPRNNAEKKYGTMIYQGGAVPGKLIRIVEIPTIDVEACAGTHLKRTSEAEQIKILKSTKIQDGIIRITFTAGEAAKKEAKEEIDILAQTAKILGVDIEQIPERAEELFTKWKKARKAVKKRKPIEPKELALVSTKRFKGDVLKKTAEIFRTQPEYIAKTAKRFLTELEEYKKGLAK